MMRGTPHLHIPARVEDPAGELYFATPPFRSMRRLAGTGGKYQQWGTTTKRGSVGARAQPQWLDLAVDLAFDRAVIELFHRLLHLRRERIHITQRQALG
jgi:hypothetical protein